MSRPFADIVAEVEALAADGVTEVTLLGQNVNSYGRDLQLAARRAGDAQRSRCARCSPTCSKPSAPSTGIRRVRFTSPHPKDMRAETFVGDGRDAGGLRAVALSAAVRLRPCAGGDAPRLHARRATSTASPKPAESSPTSPCRPTSSSAFPGETDDDFAATLGGRRRGTLRRRLHVHLLATPRHGGGRDGRPLRRPGRGGGAFRPPPRRHRAQRPGRQSSGGSAASRRSSSKDRARRTRPSSPGGRGSTGSSTSRRRTSCGRAAYADVEITAAAPHHLTARFVEQTADARHRIRIPVAAG